MTIKGACTEKNEIEEERRDKRLNVKSMGDNTAFHFISLCPFHFSVQSVSDVLSTFCKLRRACGYLFMLDESVVPVFSLAGVMP